MSATTTEAEAIAHGWTVYRRAMESEWAAEKATGRLVVALHDALTAKDAGKALALSRAVLDALDYASVINPAWQVYRRSQEIPFPAKGGGDLIRAQSRLWHLAEPFASGRRSCGADLDGIRLAAADLTAVIAKHCGDEAAAFASGQDRSVAA